MAPRIRRSHDDYTVAWICALSVETAAAKFMLEEIHEDLPIQSNDHNAYILGRIWEHNVVIACLPSGKYGTISASAVVNQLLSTFRSIRFGLMVGIGGAVTNGGADVRLGDIVVSNPTSKHGGVVEYDYGKMLSDGHFQRTGALSHPPQILLTATSKLRARHANTNNCQFLEFYAPLLQKAPVFARPSLEDRLYKSNYVHRDVESETCTKCDPSKTAVRPRRTHETPNIHYGLIASAYQVVKDSKFRDKLGSDLGAYCVEMEAAGLMDSLPFLVIRGICDYADSHKNKVWQGYASAVAAAYAKELLLYTPVNRADRVLKYQVPFDLATISAVRYFVGREDELENLWHHLRPSAQNSRKVAAVHGLGGMGKTQLAVHFAWIHKDDFTAVFWLNAKNRETLVQSMSLVLPKLSGQYQSIPAGNEQDVRQNTAQVLKWLALPGNKNWLLIFDNVDEYSLGTKDGYDIRQFFPASDQGSILITSRLLGVRELAKPFHLQKLELKHATELLLWNTGTEATGCINQDIIDLANQLDGLPLAITIARAYIRGTGTSFSKYLDYYRKSWHQLQLHSRPDRNYEHGNLLETWIGSLNEIKRRDPDAAELMLFIAHFDNQNVWYELLRSGPQGLRRPRWFDSIMLDELTFRNKMRRLVEISFIDVNTHEGGYTMHPVLRDWCFSIVGTQGEGISCRQSEMALISVGHTVPFKSEPDSWVLEQRLLPHADCVLNKLRTASQTNDIEICNSLRRIGDLYTSRSRLEDAKRAYKLGIAACENVLGPNYQLQQTTLQLYKSLAITHDIQGRISDAEKDYKHAIAGFQAQNRDPKSALEAMNHLGNLYLRYDMLDKAEQTYQTAQSKSFEMFGPNHILTLDILDNVGVVHRSLGRLEEAETTCRRALNGKMKALGSDHVLTINAFSNLAHIYYINGKLDEAAQLHQRSLAAIEKTLGLDHFSAMHRFYSLAWIYHKQEKYEVAQEMFERALEGYTKMLGPDHQHTLNAAYAFGNFWLDRGRKWEAERLYKQARSGYERTMGPDHLLTLEVAQKSRELASPSAELAVVEPTTVETPNRRARTRGIFKFSRGR